MTDARLVRVFISSPEDVRPERGIAARIVQRLAREFSHHFRVEPVLWEREPLLASAHFQDGIIAPHDADIVVIVLWSRLGLPLPADKYAGALSGRRVTGTEWEFEDALASYRAHGRPEVLLYLKRAPVNIRLGERAEVEEQQRQAELVEDFMRRWFSDAEGVSATAASWRFDDGAAFETLLEPHLRELLRRRISETLDNDGAGPVRWYQGSPYRGLEAFEPQHEPIFFGRTRARNEVRELLARQVAAGNAFVLVMGASGSGKSSLVKAAVVPELREAGMVGHAAFVRYAITRPAAFTPGGDPLTGLATAVLAEAALPELAPATTPEALADLLRHAPPDAIEPIRSALAQAGRAAGLTERGEARLLLVIDQLEELFTADGFTPDARERYVAALAALAASGLVWVIATLRSDFFDRLERSPTLARLAGGEAKYLLTPPDEAEIGQIILQPAREAGLRFEIDDKTGRGLDETIREAAAGDTASLPLLEYLLDQLWHRRTDTGQLTYAAYRDLGGLEGAIGHRAEEVLAAQAPEVQAALPRVLRALVTVRPGARSAATARYARLDQLPEGGNERRLIEALLAPRARLLVADDDTIRVAHEALLTHWRRAQDQIAEDRADLQLRARLEEAAARWQAVPENDRGSLLLTPGLPLSEAEDFVQRRREELDTGVTAYIEASGAAARQRQRRATTRLSIVAAVLAVLTLGAGIGAWQAVEGRRAAESALKRAETNLDQALALVDTITRGTVGQFENLGLPKDRAKALLNQIDPVLRVLEQQQTSDAVARRRWELLIRLVDLYLALGDATAAAKHARAALDIASKAAQDSPGDLQRQRELGLSHERIGDLLLTQGDLNAALGAYGQYLDIAAGLVARDPTNPVWSRNLSVAYEKHGNIHWSRGELTAALAAQRKSLEIRQGLATRDKTNVEWQRDISISYEKIGGLLRLQGDLAGAREAYQKSHDICQSLSARDPANTQWQRDLTIAQRHIGEVMMEQGDLAGAVGMFRASHKIAVALAQHDPADARWQRDLSISFERLGDALRTQGDLAGALTAYRESMDVGRKLAVRDPTNNLWQRDLAVSYVKIGDILRAQRDFAAALAPYREGLDLRQRLAARDPGNAIWQRDLMVSHMRVGDVLAAQRDTAGADVHYRSALDIARRLLARDPANAEAQIDLSATHDRAGDAARARGDLSGALAAYRESQEIRRRLVARDPSNAEWQRALAISHDYVGQMLEALGDGDDALSAYRDCLAIRERLAKQQPSNLERRREFAATYGRIATANHRRGDLPSAIEAARHGLSMIRELLVQRPGHPQWKQDEAWLAGMIKTFGGE